MFSKVKIWNVRIIQYDAKIWNLTFKDCDQKGFGDSTRRLVKIDINFPKNNSRAFYGKEDWQSGAETIEEVTEMSH